MHLGSANVDPEDPVRLRIGISAGEVAEEDGDWFGLPVVEAARLCGAAGSGRTIANAVIRTLVGSRAADHHLRDVGPMQLKGLAAPIAVVEVDGPDPESTVGAVAPGAVIASTLAAAGAGSASGLVDGPDGAPTVGHPLRPTRRRVVVTAIVVVVGLVGLGAAVVRWSGGGADPSVEAGTSTTVAAVSSPNGYEPSFRSVACSAAVEEDVPGAECGELAVPASRADPNGPTLVVPVTKRPAAVDTGAAPVVLVDVNEPLGRTPLAGTTDVYSMALRGFTPGVGPDLTCPELSEAWPETFDESSDDPAGMDARVAAAGACADRLRSEGVALEGYNMAEVADDIRDLVLAADLGRVSAAGGGFTSTAVIEFARANPGAVVAVLLINPVMPGDSPLADPAGWISAALRKLATACTDDPECTVKDPDLLTRYEDQYDTFTRSPEVVPASSLIGTGPYQVRLDGRRWAAALEAALYQSAQLGLVPRAVDNASLDLIAATGIDEDIKTVVAPAALPGAMLSYMCSYDASPNVTAEISAKASPEYAGANDAAFQRMCQAWGVPSVYDELSQPLTGDVPVLLVQGGYAVSGINDWAGGMAGLLDRATVVRLDTMGEDLAYAQPPCLRRLRSEFVADPRAPLDVAGCEAASPPIDFSP
jgi:pimeloyl-ACP methyl ester carboxylesterase